MRVTIETVYDFDHIAFHMESIINKYTQMPVGCIYLKGSRQPISDRHNLERYNKLGMVSDKPFHPIIAPAMIRDVVLNIASELNPHRGLLNNNSITNTCNPIYPPVESIENVILGYTPNITEEDGGKLIGYINQLTKPIEDIISENPEYIYGVCIETRYFKFLRHEDIRAYRYQEAVTHMESNDV